MAAGYHCSAQQGLAVARRQEVAHRRRAVPLPGLPLHYSRWPRPACQSTSPQVWCTRAAIRMRSPGASIACASWRTSPTLSQTARGSTLQTLWQLTSPTCHRPLAHPHRLQRRPLLSPRPRARCPLLLTHRPYPLQATRGETSKTETLEDWVHASHGAAAAVRLRRKRPISRSRRLP